MYSATQTESNNNMNSPINAENSKCLVPKAEYYKYFALKSEYSMYLAEYSMYLILKAESLNFVHHTRSRDHTSDEE